MATWSASIGLLISCTCPRASAPSSSCRFPFPFPKGKELQFCGISHSLLSFHSLRGSSGWVVLCQQGADCLRFLWSQFRCALGSQPSHRPGPCLFADEAHCRCRSFLATLLLISCFFFFASLGFVLYLLFLSSFAKFHVFSNAFVQFQPSRPHVSWTHSVAPFSFWCILMTSCPSSH